MRLLILGVGGDVGCGIARIASEVKGLELKIIGACTSNFPSGSGFCDIVIKSPAATDVSFKAWLLKIIDKYDISHIISGQETIIHTLAKLRADLNSVKILILSDWMLSRFGCKLKSFKECTKKIFNSARRCLQITSLKLVP